MIIPSIVILAIVLGIGAILLYKDSAEETKRKNTPCNFDNGIPEHEFKQIAETACKSVKRIINFTIDGPTIRGTVRSQSGVSDWRFILDFNDYGKISGQYWITSKNDDSKIPEIIAERIKADIKNYN